MAKYKVGDTFIATITEIDTAGMGTTYVLNDSVIVDEARMQNFNPYENRSNSPVDEPKEDKAREYTIDELKERILVMVHLLNKTVEAYEDATRKVKSAIDTADGMIKG